MAYWRCGGGGPGGYDLRRRGGLEMTAAARSRPAGLGLGLRAGPTGLCWLGAGWLGDDAEVLRSSYLLSSEATPSPPLAAIA